MSQQAKQRAPERVGLNITIPASVHRRAKAAAGLTRMTWDQAAAEAFEAWATSKGIPAAQGGRSR